jgi:molecular chaperone DnaK
MTSERIIGIDLGTTHTLVAEMNAAGQSQILQTPEGESLIPSVVLFADQQTIVGREAQVQGEAAPERLAACAKWTLGQSFYKEAIGGEQLAPEVIQACILEQAKRQFLGSDSRSLRAVIAVPAHFNQIQWQATAMAAQMAGLNVLDLVSEPVAAALAFDEHRSPVPPLGACRKPGPILVFDLGGYTFEASVLLARPRGMSVVATEHDIFLGGHEWDLRLANLLADAYADQHGLDPNEKFQHIEHMAERLTSVKHALSGRPQASVRLAFGNSCHIIKVTRAEFEGATADLVERTGKICDRVLKQAGLDWSRVDRVLLVGGATRMPMISRMLTQRLGRAPDSSVAPEEAVARGASLYAAKALRSGGYAPTLRFTSLSTHSLGLEDTDPKTGARIHRVLIPKDTPLPARASHKITVKCNYRSVIVKVLEGENPDPNQCVTIGRILLRDLPETGARQWNIELTFEYSASGHLTVDAHVPGTHCCVHFETDRPGGGSVSHLVHWRPVVNALAGFDAFRRVRAWEQASDAPPPPAVAGLEHKQTARPLSFIRRMMPFLAE